MSSAAKKGGAKGKRESTNKAAAKGKDAKKDPKAAKKDTKDTKAAAAAKGAGKGKAAANGKAATNGKAAPAKGKGGAAAAAKGGKGGGAAAKASKKEEKEYKGKSKEEVKQQGQIAAKHAARKASKIAIDFGPPVIIPEFKEFETTVPAMTKIELEEDNNVEELKEQFDAIGKLLKDRRKACLTHARELVAQQGEDTAPICIDIAGITHMINNIGSKRGEADYKVLTTKQQLLDRGRALLAYEAQYKAVSEERKGTSEKAVQAEINDCKKVLDEAEPVLQASKEALKSITKASLDEIRALPKPHKLLVKAVKACAIMVGKDPSELEGWPNIKKLLKTSFIDSLLQFEARNITAETRKVLEGKNFLARGDDSIPESDRLTFDNVNKANAVAGCLVQWLEAQLKYNEFIPKVEPIQDKLEQLKIQLGNVEGIQKKLDDALAELEQRAEDTKKGLREDGKVYGKAVAAANACK